MQIVVNFGQKRCISRQQLQSLLGKLLYISKIIVPARAFLNRMLACLRNSGNHKWVALSTEFQKDLSWFRKSLGTFNDTVTFHIIQEQEHIVVFVDASLRGLGVLWGEEGIRARFQSTFVVAGT